MPKKLKGIVKEVWENKIKQKPSENKHISYSQLSSFATCQRQWYWAYVKNLAPYQPSVHAVFGTAMHETIQTWLEVLYHDKVNKAMDMDLNNLLYENLTKAYKAQKAQSSHEHFSNQQELTQFWEDGKQILNYLKKERSGYFSTKTMMLAGVETLLYQELRPGVKFKGFIDLVFYHPVNDTWTIVDIKTSTSGWSNEVKKNDTKTAQLLLYKQFFSEQFNIPIEKITVEYHILKRRVPSNPEFPAASRRMQIFKPAAGKIKVGKALSLMNNFVTTAVDENGDYIDKEYPTNPSRSNCRFCAFKDMKLCKDAVK